jgi:hypothetical protein
MIQSPRNFGVCIAQDFAPNTQRFDNQMFGFDRIFVLNRGEQIDENERRVGMLVAVMPAHHD